MNVLKFRCSSCAAIVSFRGPCERCARQDSLNRIMAPYEKPLLKCKAMRPEGLYYGEWNGQRDYRTGKRLAYYLFGFFAQLCTGGRRHDVPACTQVDRVLAMYDRGYISRDQANELPAEPECVKERERMEAQMAADYARLLGSEWEEP